MNEVIITRGNISDKLEHHGILGMKWGVRRYQTKSGSLTNLGRKRYSSKDGSLNKRGKKEYEKETAKLKAEKKLLKNKARTQKKLDKLKDLNDEVDDLKKAETEAKSGESREEKRKRLLESTDAKELYENRNLLTTAELNDRINRIDTEARLASKIPQEKTGIDYINDKMNRTSNTLNNATNMFQKVDNAYATVSKSAVGKVLAKKLGIEPKKKAFDYDDFIKNISTKSTQEVKDAAARSTSENLLKSNIEKMKGNGSNSSSSNNSQNTTTNSQTSNDSKGSSNQTSTYNSNNNTSPNNSSDSGSSSSASKVFTGTVEGEGTSRYRKTGNSYVDNNPTWHDVSTKASEYSEVSKIGSQYIAGYLPYNDKK